MSKIRVTARVRHRRIYYHEGTQLVTVLVPLGSNLEEVERALIEEADRTSGDVDMQIKSSSGEPDEIEIEEWCDDPVKIIQDQANAAGP